MILSQILYTKNNNSRKSTLILILGKKGNKLIAILDEAIDKKTAILIEKNSKKIDKMPLQNKVAWIKSHAYNAYKAGYREFIISKVKVQRSYSITNRKYIKS